MVDRKYIPAIKETIKQNEIGNASPYVLSFAKLGKSGASFGALQGDTNVNPLARATLTQVLVDANATTTQINRIMASLSQPLPGGNPLSQADTKLVANALISAQGKDHVDTMDAQLLQSVLAGVDSCIAAGAPRKLTIAPLALLYIAPWVNMTGPPALLASWIGGKQAQGLQPPSPPTLDDGEMSIYLQATAYFQAHPQNYKHYLQCIAIGAKLLP